MSAVAAPINSFTSVRHVSERPKPYDPLIERAFGWLVPYRQHWYVKLTPHAFSLIRVLMFLLALPLWHAVRAGHTLEASGWLFVCLLLWTSDAIDGALARMLEQSDGTLGKALDPLCDKLAIWPLLIVVWSAFSQLHPSHWQLLAGLVIVRASLDGMLVLLAVAGWLMGFEGGANWGGKAKLHCDIFAFLAGSLGAAAAVNGTLRANALADSVIVLVFLATMFAVISVVVHLKERQPAGVLSAPSA